MRIIEQITEIEQSSDDYQKKVDKLKAIRKQCEDAIKRIINERLKDKRRQAGVKYPGDPTP